MSTLQQPSNRAQNNWRRSTGALPSSAPFYATSNGYGQAQQQLAQMQQQSLLAKQQEIYNLQQAQMELQLQQLRMQNLEIQERILAASSGQNHESISANADLKARRRSALFSGLNLPLAKACPVAAPASAPFSQETFFPEQDNSRQELEVKKKPNRLSFAGAEGLAEHALARKRSGAFSPPTAEVRTPPAQMLTHHRKTSSQSSTSSQFLSEQRRQMSPPSGPTLVLSQPGEKYQAPTLAQLARTRQLSVNTNEARSMPATQENSDASSPHSSDCDSLNSEPTSFDSITTVASDGSYKPLGPPPAGKRAISDSGYGNLAKASLNPSASAFLPVFTVPSPVAEQQTFRGKKDSGSLGMQYPSSLERPSGFRHVTAPAAMTHGAIAIRQPRGPAKEDELASMNFNGRLRKQALLSLKTLKRSSFVAPVDTQI